MLRRVDDRARLLALAAIILGPGTAAFYLGVPLLWGERVPLGVCLIPPSIFALLVIVTTVGNALQVRTARRLLVHGQVLEPVAWTWIVFAHTTPGEPENLRTWSIPGGELGADARAVNLDLLDTHRDFMPRQTRTVGIRLGDGASLTITGVPSHVGADILRSSAVLHAAAGRTAAYGVAVPDVGLFIAIRGADA